MSLPTISVNETQPQTEKIFEAESGGQTVDSVAVHEPETEGDDIVLPIVITVNGKPTVFRSYLDKDRWREILG